MLAGQAVTLRQVREADLDALYDAHTDISSRGAYFPLGVLSQTAFRREFADHGFWEKSEGMLVIESSEGEIAGHIEFSDRSRTGMPSSCPTSSTPLGSGGAAS